MKTKQPVILGIVSLAVIVLVLLIFRGRNGDDSGVPSRRPTISGPVRERPGPSQIPPVAPTPPKPPDVVERGKAVAVVASSRMVEERAIEFGNLVRSIWSAELGTVFAVADNRDDVQVPDGMKVASLDGALSRCAMCLLLWDEDIQRSVAKELKDYCETGGWLVFVSSPWIGSPPKSSPTELLRYERLGGVADLEASAFTGGRRAVAMLRHPSIPDLPLGKALRVYLQSGKCLGGGDGRAIPLVRFEEPALRGVNIQAVAHGGIIEVNWDCPAGGRIGETESDEFIKTILAWLAEKETWREPVEQPGVPLKIIARTPTGDPAPGAEITVKLHTDWAKSVSQEIVTVGDNGEGEIPAKAPAIYIAWAAGEGYSSDTLALVGVEEGTVPEPLVVTVRPSLRIVGKAVYTGEATGPASEVPVDLLPSSRSRGMDVASTLTDDEGRFAFDGVPGGRPYLLRCEAEEWAGLEEIDLPESTDSGTFEVTLGLKKLVAIDGLVVEEDEEQKPIEGATVRSEPYWGVKALPLFLRHLRGRSTSSGAEGEFKVLVLPDLTYHVTAGAPGYLWRELGPDRTNDGALDVRPPATLTLELYPGTTVKGTVYLPGGQPAACARVTLLRLKGLRDATQTTDLDGRFCFSCVPVSQRLADKRLKHLIVSGESGRFTGFKSVRVPVEETKVEVVLNLEEAPLIRGAVTDRQQSPVGGAGLYFSGTLCPPAAHTDENGLFEIPLPAPLMLSVWKEGYSSVRVKYDALEAAARDNSLLAVILPRSGGRIAGRVLSHDGDPLRNEVVDFTATSGRVAGMVVGWQHRMTLGDRGEFQLEGIRIEEHGAGLSEVQVKFIDLSVKWYPDQKSEGVQLTASASNIPIGAADVVLRFDPLFEVRGRVVDGQNGVPIEGAFLKAWNRSVISNTSGEFRFQWATAGQHVLSASCAGYLFWQEEIDVGPGVPDIGDIFLSKSVIVRGHAVYERSGVPVEGAEVRIQTRSYVRATGEYAVVDCAQGTTDSAGRFNVRIDCPYADSGTESPHSYEMFLGIVQGLAGEWREFNSSQAGTLGVIDVGAIKLEELSEQK